MGNQAHVYANNITCKNVEIYSNCIKIINSQHIEIKDIKFENVTLMSGTLLFVAGDTVIMENVSFDLIAGIGNEYEGGIQVYPRISSNISNISVKNSISMPSSEGFMLVNSDTFGACIISDVVFESIRLVSTFSFIKLKKISNALVINITVKNIEKSTENDFSVALIDLSSVSSSVDSNYSISNVYAEQSSVQILKVSAQKQKKNINTYLEVSNVTHIDSKVKTEEDIFSFEKITSNQTFTILIEDIIFRNLYFEVKGNLMNFQHQLSLAMQVNNLDIYNVTHAGIHVESTDPSGLDIDTKIKFVNITAALCDLKTTSLFVLKEGANIQVFDSNFSFISNILYGSVAYAGFQKAIGEFYNSEFKNNTSIDGGVFLTEEVSVIRLFN